MSAPRLNLLANPVLTGLLYRALAADTDSSGADLTQHHLEQLQARNTGLLQDISSHRANLKIQEERARKAAYNAHQSQLDLQLFVKQHPPEPRRRGLFGPRLTKEQRAVKVQRTELAGIAAATGADSARQQELAVSRGNHLEKLVAGQQAVQQERGLRMTEFQGELAGNVLGLIAADRGEEARLALASARIGVRGDLMVAVLLVITELLCSGTDAALVTLGELKPLFRQHADPLPRILGVLIGLRHAGTVSRRDVGAFAPGSFSTPAFNRLYQLTRVLAGWSYDEDQLADDPFAATLWILRELVFAECPPTDWEPPPVEFLTGWAATAEPVTRTMALSALLIRGAESALPAAASIDPATIPPPRHRNGQWPVLLDLLGDPPPAWPAALTESWQVIAACHVMLAAGDTAPTPLYEQWLAECYNWPKDDLYWWMLARIKNDQGLLENIRRDPTQATAVPL